MVKKIIKFFLITGILSLFIFGANFALAVSPPGNPETDETEVTFHYIAREFSWEKNTEDDVNWYHIVYWCKQNCPTNQGDAKWVIQPADPGRVPTLFIGGFDFSSPAADAIYQWQVGACSAAVQGACVYSDVDDFPSSLQPEPPASPGPLPGTVPGTFALINPLAAETLQEALEYLLNFLFFLVMALAPLLIIYAAFLLLASGGDAAKINRGKQIIFWTLIAVALVLFAKGFPALIKGVLGG